MGWAEEHERKMEDFKNSPGCLKFIAVLIMIAGIVGILYGCISCVF